MLGMEEYRNDLIIVSTWLVVQQGKLANLYLHSFEKRAAERRQVESSQDELVDLTVCCSVDDDEKEEGRKLHCILVRSGIVTVSQSVSSFGGQFVC